MRPTLSDVEFWSLFRLISVEVENAFIAFHSFEELKRLAISDAAILRVLQEDSLFWRVYRSALQTTMFMTLSRLFDPSPDATTFQKLLTATVANPQLFDEASLRARKLKSGVPVERLDDYISEAWIPASSVNLKFLKEEFRPLSEHYTEVYLPIRHNVYAHRLMSDEVASRELFPKTNRNILTETVNALYDFTMVIEGLYLNGTKPVLGAFDVAGEAKRIRSTVESPLRKILKEPREFSPVQESHSGIGRPTALVKSGLGGFRL